MAETSAALEVSGLTHEYGSLRALSDVELRVHRGQIFGLIGPNGAGKTTLIRSLIGSLRPTSGSVEVLGLDPRSDRWALRSRLGYMPQSPALYDDLTTRGNVAFFLAGHQRDHGGPLVDEALEFADLGDRAGDRVHTLSGGMKQRLSLACALVHRPSLLLLDEPTAGVDPELRASFWQRFRRLAEAGTTILVSTHQMDEAFVCDRIAVLSRGRVVANDQPRSLAPGARAIVRLWRAGIMSEHRVADYRTELPALLATPADRVEIEHETLEDIVLRLIRGET
jgi:ABC-2 type transport system ATP-binding protein